MRRRRKTDGIAETVIVKTDDGKTFRCSIVSTGEETEPHWVLMDEHAEQFLGPPVIPEPAPKTIQEQISEWWAGQKGPREPQTPSPAPRGKPDS